VTRCGQHLQLETVGDHHVAVVETLVADPELRVGRAHATSHRRGERRRCLGVVGVTMGQQHHCHLRGSGADSLEMTFIVGAGVDDDAATSPWVVRAAQHPGVGAVERHRPGVGRENPDRLCHSGSSSVSSHI
jgi:hypothetical protein